MKRRKVLKSIALGTTISGLTSFSIVRNVQSLFQEYKINQLTHGKKQHWFGYYDKEQIDPTGKYALAMEIPVDVHRSPQFNDVVNIGLIDIDNNNKWETIGNSSAWSWQQGCMLQWIPGSAEEVIWNTRLADKFVSIVYNIKTKKERVLPKPIYTLDKSGRFGLGVDFERLQIYRPGYGYAAKEAFTPENAPLEKGIYTVDLKTGENELIISYKKISELGGPLGDLTDYHHWINHLLINPTGTRFIFLNRSRGYIDKDEWLAKEGKRYNGEKRSYLTRAITANVDGSDIYALNDSGLFSHFIWKGEDEICAWAKTEDRNQTGFYLFQDKTKRYETVGEGTMIANGHNTYVPNTNYEWILNDTYPDKKNREQELYLYHVPTDRKVSLGRFHEPEKFKGELRCDLHPRCNQQGTKVFFDSTHNGNKRQVYSVDIAKIVGTQ